jgi:zinc/manganese transport system permease protein
MVLPVVGALLVFSLMVGPASAARTLTDRPLRAMLLSAVLAVVTVWSSIALSFVSGWPIGFFVGGLSAVAYGAGRTWMWGPVSRRGAPTAAVHNAMTHGRCGSAHFGRGLKPTSSDRGDA